MANYTMELREYIESWSQDNIDKMKTLDIIEAGRPKLFDFDYPIFDSDYKKVFETHFIRKFYMREIGFETEGLFKFNLETWLLINMPYFNKLFESELIQYNPLENSTSDVTHHNTKNNTANTTVQNAGHSSGNSTRNTNATTGTDETTTTSKTDFNRALESNNPDSRLQISYDNGNGTSTIEYASQINENTENGSASKTFHSGGNNSSNESVSGTSDNTNNQTSNGTINETEDYIQHRVGKIGVQTYAKMIQEHRQAFLRIENQIFNEMQELFMLVY